MHRLMLSTPVVLILLCTPLALGQQEKAEALCSDTVAALQKTDAAPLAKLLSAHAGTFLLSLGDRALLLNASALANKDKWADQPLLSEAAKLGEVKASDRLYATRVEATIEDGDKKYVLDGVAMGEGGRLKWGMAAVVPKPAEPQDEKAVSEVLGLMNSWMEALAGGNVNPLLEALSPEAMAVAVVGPDYGFYVFNDLADLRAVAEQAMGMGGLNMLLPQEPQVTLSGPVALLKGLLTVDVAGQTSKLECWAHLVRTEPGWRLAALFALPPEQ